MDANLNKLLTIKISKTIKALEDNGMKAMYVPSRKEALALLKTMLVEGETIAVGGSVTLNEMDAISYLRDKKFNFIDRYEKGISQDELTKRFREGLLADTFLTSTNAITENGFLYNVDGTGNRAAAFVYGPKRVIVFAGYNKIVPTLRDAVVRVKTKACPANAIRLDRDSYCVKNGKCIKPESDPEDLMFFNSELCKNCICCSAVITSKQKTDRITVVIIGEELGY